jgi:hypothetical protein
MSTLCDLRTFAPTVSGSDNRRHHGVDWHAAFAERRFKLLEKTVGTFNGCKSLRKPSPRSGCLFEAGDLMRFCVFDTGDRGRSRFQEIGEKVIVDVEAHPALLPFTALQMQMDALLVGSQIEATAAPKGAHVELVRKIN